MYTVITQRSVLICCPLAAPEIFMGSLSINALFYYGIFQYSDPL